MLEINKLSFSYRKHAPPVLDGLDLELGKGEIGVILGKNGSGKTTLLKNILGIHTPASGDILFNGKSLVKMRTAERARIAACVPQDIRFGSLSVYDTVLTGRAAYFGFRAGKEDHDKTEKILEDMGLSEYAMSNTDELSGGQRQKTAIARAMAQEPRLMLFDEPTGNLDIANRLLLIKEVKKLARDKNIAVLMSLQDLNEAFSFGDKFFLLKDGKIRYSGSSESISAEMIEDVYDIPAKIIQAGNRKIIIL